MRQPRKLMAAAAQRGSTLQRTTWPKERLTWQNERELWRTASGGVVIYTKCCAVHLPVGRPYWMQRAVHNPCVGGSNRSHITNGFGRRRTAVGSMTAGVRSPNRYMWRCTVLQGGRSVRCDGSTYGSTSAAYKQSLGERSMQQPQKLMAAAVQCSSVLQ